MHVPKRPLAMAGRELQSLSSCQPDSYRSLRIALAVVNARSHNLSAARSSCQCFDPVLCPVRPRRPDGGGPRESMAVPLQPTVDHSQESTRSYTRERRCIGGRCLDSIRERELAEDGRPSAVCAASSNLCCGEVTALNGQHESICITTTPATNGCTMYRHALRTTLRLNHVYILPHRFGGPDI